MNVERVGDVVYSDYRHIIGVEEEQVPTHLNTNDMGPYLAVSADNLSVKYIGQRGWGHDVGSLQANCPAPIRKLLYYFEMYVENRGRRSTVSIGFTHQHFHKNRQPGWEPNTFGYHGDDGRMFHDSGFGMPFGPTYTTGDTVGAGINNASQDVFFTKNGEFIGSITKDYEGALFPTVGLHSPDERVVVNFGQQEFVFDIQVAETRFASNTIVLRRLVKVRKALSSMVISESWSIWRQSNTERATNVKKMILNDTWRDRVEYLLSFTEPIMSMIRFTDMDKQCLGEVYDGIDSMLEKMKSIINAKEQDPEETLFKEVQSICVEGWNKMTTPLHLLGFGLTPKY